MKKWTRAYEARYNKMRYGEFVGVQPAAADMEWYAAVKHLRTEHLFRRLFGKNRKGRKARKMWEKRIKEPKK